MMTKCSKIRLQVSILRANGPLGTIYAHGGQLGHAIWAIYTNFGFDWSRGFCENLIKFFIITNLWPRSCNDLDFELSYNFINIVRYLCLSAFR